MNRKTKKKQRRRRRENGFEMDGQRTTTTLDAEKDVESPEILSYTARTGKLNFVDKPFDQMTPKEKIDASTNWRELTDKYGRRFYYNKETGVVREWTIPHELLVARYIARDCKAAENRTHLPPFLRQRRRSSSIVMQHVTCKQICHCGNVLSWNCPEMLSRVAPQMQTISVVEGNKPQVESQGGMT